MADEAIVVTEEPSEPPYQEYKQARRAGQTPGEAAGTPPASDETPPEAVSQDSSPASESAEDTEPDRTQQRRRDRDSKRWQRMSNNLRGMRTENEQLREEIKALRDEVKQLIPRQVTPPVRENYETEEAYLDAAIEWRSSQQPTQEAADSPPAQPSAQSAAPSTGAAAFAAFIEAGEDRYDDFEQVVLQSPVAVGQLALEAILENPEVGADVAYYLATHKEEADALRALRPLAFAREWAKLEAKFTNGTDPPPEETEPPSASEPPARREPEPINPVRTDSTASVDRPMDELPYQDYAKRRRQELRRRR